MEPIDAHKKQQADEILGLEIAYSNLYRAYTSDNREEMIMYYMTAGLVQPNFNQKVLSESRKVFYSRRCYPDNIPHPIQQVPMEQLKLNVEGCLNALRLEINQKGIYKTNYAYALGVLDNPYHTFKKEEILYTDKRGQQLKVADVLSVVKYAISVAESINPSDERYSQASAAITALQGIDAILNNKSEDKPVNKMLHLITSFLSSTVKSAAKDDEAKRNITISTILVDLAIDFFCKK